MKAHRFPTTVAAVLATVLLAGVFHAAAADSFWDWLKKDQQAQKEFSEGKQPATAPQPQPAPKQTLPPRVAPAPTPVPVLTPPPVPPLPPVVPVAPVAPPPIAPEAVAPDRAGPADWLVMVYMAGDNSLDSATVDDVKEMEKVGSSSNLKVVVLMDRLEGSEWSTARRFLVHKSGSSELKGKHSWDPSLSSCQDLGELNMGDPETLKDFVAWALQTYPATNTMLVLWNHGGGWRDATARAVSRGGGMTVSAPVASLTRGIAWDDGNGNDFLETREVGAALDPFPTFSVLACDACLMAMIECAYEWRDEARYFVASEETEPGDGWPYDTVLKLLADKPRTTPAELAAHAVKAYDNFYKLRDRTTQSAVDLSKVEPLARAFDAFAVKLMAFVQNGGRLPDGFMEVTGFPAGNADFIDLDAFLEQAETAGSLDAETRAAAKTARVRFAEAIVANASHAKLKGRGLTIFPGGGSDAGDYNARIIRFAADTHWDECLRQLLFQRGEGIGRTATISMPDRWAVLIGVGAYRDPAISRLAYTDNDVEGIRDALVRVNGYDPEKVIVLTNEMATAESVRSTLGTVLPRKVREQDMVMIYFSGHGGAEPSVDGRSDDGTEKYMLLADSKLSDMYSTAIPMSELARIFGRIRADKILFVMDACYSGATSTKDAMRGGTMKSVTLSDDYLTKLAGSKGTVVLTASRANEVSMESPRLRHGVFTHHLVQTLLGIADADGDGITTLSEAVQYILQMVPQDAKTMGASQHPVMKGEVSGVFPVAIGSGNKAAAATPAP